jgi:hypothetical protein
MTGWRVERCWLRAEERPPPSKQAHLDLKRSIQLDGLGGLMLARGTAEGVETVRLHKMENLKMFAKEKPPVIPSTGPTP